MMSETGLQRRRGRASAGPDGTGGGNAGDCGELIARRRELQGEPGTGAIRQRRIGRGKEKKGEISKEESQRKEAPQTQRLRGRRGRLGRGGSRRPGSKWKVDNRERASRARECLDPMDGCWPYRSRGSVFLPRASLPPRHHHRLLHLSSAAHRYSLLPNTMVRNPDYHAHDPILTPALPRQISPISDACSSKPEQRPKRTSTLELRYDLARTSLGSPGD